MPSYLQRLRGTTRTQITPCWLHEDDAKRAAADLENIQVVTNDRWANNAPFPKVGFHSQGVREVMAERWWAGEVEREVRRYHSLGDDGRHTANGCSRGSGTSPLRPVD